ncbi:MAG: hypothetical protein AAGE52_05235 [Myxococcota bacterium]
MSKRSYRGLLALLLAGGLGGLAVSAYAVWIEHSFVEHDCESWLSAPTRGRVRLRGCPTQYGHGLLERPHVLMEVRGGDETTPRAVWYTREADLTGFRERLERADDDERARVLRRFADKVNKVRDIEGVAYLYEATVPEIGEAPSLIAEGIVGLAVALVFFFGFVLVVRTQRRWTRARRAWERSHGVIHASTDDPTAF